jgi:hypothetical protein
MDFCYGTIPTNIDDSHLECLQQLNDILSCLEEGHGRYKIKDILSCMEEGMVGLRSTSCPVWRKSTVDIRSTSCPVWRKGMVGIGSMTS